MVFFLNMFLRGFLLSLLVSIQYFASAETIDTEIKRRLEVIRAYNSGQTEAISSPKEVAHAMQATISELINGVYKMEAGVGSTPSSQRQALIDRFASVIAPYNNDLMKVGFTSDPALSDLAHQCRSLLDHTKPDDAFAAALREHLTDLTSDASYAYDLLFQHRLLTATEKTDLGRKVLAEPERENRIRWAVKCSKMSIPEVVPVLAEMLSVPFNAAGTTGSTGVFGENEALSNYCKAIEAINTLGPQAASVLPLLADRLKEIEAMLPREQARIYSPQFRSAIAQIEGRKPLLIPTAINGSGPLVASSVLSLHESVTPKTTTPLPATSASSATPASRSPATLVSSPLLTAGHQVAMWPWLVGSFTLAVIAALLWKRR